MYGESSRLFIHRAKFLGKPVNPIARDKNADPANMKEIIQDVFVAPNNELLKFCLLYTSPSPRD